MTDSSGNETCDSLGHDDEITYEEDDGIMWVCRRCGAEGWEDV
jgi:hypothetical protein